MSVAAIDSNTLKNSSVNDKNSEKSNKQGRFYYTVGMFNFLLEAGIKAENLHGLTVNSVPHVPAWCIGVVNVRGNIIPVVDMHVFLKTGMSRHTNKNKKLLLLERENQSSIIFQIDTLPKVTFLGEYSRKKLPEKTPSWLIRHFKNENHNLYEINHTDLLTALKKN